MQADLLVHDDHLVVGPGRNQDEVAGTGAVDHLLDRLTRAHHTPSWAVGRWIDGIAVAADGEGDTAGADFAVVAHDLELIVASGGIGGYSHFDDVVIPTQHREGSGHAIKPHASATLCRAEAKVACDGFGCGVGTVVGRIGHINDAGRHDAHAIQKVDIHDGVGLIAHIGPAEAASRGGVSFRGVDHRRAVRILAIEGELAGPGKGGDGDHRSIQIGSLARQILERVAELAVLPVEEGIDDHLARIVGILDRPGMVHAGGQHVGRQPGRHRDVYRIGGRHQGVVGAPLVRVDPGNLAAGPVADGDRQMRRRMFLAEGRRVRVELVGGIVEDEPGQMG